MHILYILWICRVNILWICRVNILWNCHKKFCCFLFYPNIFFANTESESVALRLHPPTVYAVLRILEKY